MTCSVGDMQKPTLEQFGISRPEFEWLQRFEDQTAPRIASAFLILGLFAGAVYALSIGGFSMVTPIAIFMFAGLGFTYAFFAAMAFYLAWRPIAGIFVPAVRRYGQYICARDAYVVWERRTRVEFWRSLSGRSFERELAAAFERQGFAVELTPPSGDKGIDIVLRRNGRTTIVQCKATAKPVGPAVARELYGTLLASGADDAILAATAGVTRAAREFLEDKPIRVVGMAEILALHIRESSHATQ